MQRDELFETDSRAKITVFISVLLSFYFQIKMLFKSKGIPNCSLQSQIMASFMGHLVS